MLNSQSPLCKIGRAIKSGITSGVACAAGGLLNKKGAIKRLQLFEYVKGSLCAHVSTVICAALPSLAIDQPLKKPKKLQKTAINYLRVKV